MPLLYCANAADYLNTPEILPSSRARLLGDAFRAAIWSTLEHFVLSWNKRVL